MMDNNNQMVINNESQICKFYENKTVFLTGGTGFMGKILIEKLLRTTDVGTIFLLIREKRGKSLHVRVDELFENVVFQRLKTERPQFKHRIVPVAGDISVSGLGLSITDRRNIVNKTNIVVHLAATVRFDEKLKVACNINVRSTDEVINMCKEMSNLAAVLYVSTAYSNCHLSSIDEKFYDNTMDYPKLEEALCKMNEAEVEKITPEVLGQWPNTYTFTKSLAENIIKAKCLDLPIGIFRPGIVVSTYKEPLEAWIDNFYGPTGVVAGTVSGLVRTMLVADDIAANIIPVDTCIAGVIAAAWDVGERGKISTPSDVQIYNYVSSCENPITWLEYTKINYLYHNRCTFSKLIWTPVSVLTANVYVYMVYKFLLHYVPAFCIDLGLLLMLKPPRALGEYRKIHKLMSVIEYFSMRDFQFTNANVRKLWTKMSATDRELFPMSVREVSWLNYFKNYTRGICIYLLKDNGCNEEVARRKARNLELLHNCCKYLFIYFALKLLWYVVQSVFGSVVSLV